jgi:hypothetical protein
LEALADAPGNEHVRLIAARAVNGRRENVTSININDAVGIEVTYQVLRQEKLLLPAFRFHSATDAHLFNTVYTDPDYMHVLKAPGRYVSTAWIPGNLLNAGIIYVTVAMSTPSSPLERHFVVDRAIAFQVQEVDDIEGTARGLYTREFPGAVRPKLTWDTRRLG